IAHELVGTPIGEALQPTQLFESAIELANFFLLAWLLKRKKFDGEVIGTYFFLYGIARFFLEYLRGDPGRGDVFGIITGTQLVALCLIVVGGFIWWLRPAMKPVPAHAQ
ncbi:MAG TPA: prolipoprotein diacylglyceryl transferase family protein, partial [Terriglobales bacterium]|nr:prolipoprotein diacylglyceryl transferase family protein [Terriglobales bacterium]